MTTEPCTECKHHAREEGADICTLRGGDEVDANDLEPCPDFARAAPASPEAPAPGLAEIERLVDEFAAAQRGPAKMRPSLGTRRALLAALSRALSEARRAAFEEAAWAIHAMPWPTAPDEARERVKTAIRALASTTRGDAR